MVPTPQETMSREELGLRIAFFARNGSFSEDLSASPTQIMDKRLSRSELILTARLGRPIREGKRVCHLCGTPDQHYKLCINPDHLIECSDEEFEHLYGKLRRENQGRALARNPKAKISAYVAALIKIAVKNGERTQQQIAEDLSTYTGIAISQQMVSDIATGRSWRDLSTKRALEVLSKGLKDE